eukprot:IDg9052t1
MYEKNFLYYENFPATPFIAGAMHYGAAVANLASIQGGTFSRDWTGSASGPVPVQ